jgi:Zn-finger nucleic acid-binding protein
MICPVCKNTLKEIDINSIKVDICENGCGGVWFDWLELKKVDEKHETDGLFLLDIPRNEDLVINHSAKRKCPRCEEEIIMLKHFSSIKKEIEIDECGNCGGFWLDAGELKKIRNQFETEADKNKAAKEYISDIFEQEVEKAHSEKEREHATGISNIAKLIFPIDQ